MVIYFFDPSHLALILIIYIIYSTNENLTIEYCLISKWVYGSRKKAERSE